jgi:hypothetical protein
MKSAAGVLNRRGTKTRRGTRSTSGSRSVSPYSRDRVLRPPTPPR